MHFLSFQPVIRLKNNMFKNVKDRLLSYRLLSYTNSYRHSTHMKFIDGPFVFKNMNFGPIYIILHVIQ